MIRSIRFVDANHVAGVEDRGFEGVREEVVYKVDIISIDGLHIFKIF